MIKDLEMEEIILAYPDGAQMQLEVSLWREKVGWHKQKRKRQCGHRGRNGSVAAASQGMPEAARSRKRQGTVLPQSLWKQHRDSANILPLSQ